MAAIWTDHVECKAALKQWMKQHLKFTFIMQRELLSKQRGLKFLLALLQPVTNWQVGIWFQIKENLLGE